MHVFAVGWGLMMAKSQEMFYFPNPDDIRARSSLLALIYLGMAVGALLSSTCQFWGIAQVSSLVKFFLVCCAMSLIKRMNRLLSVS